MPGRSGVRRGRPRWPRRSGWIRSGRPATPGRSAYPAGRGSVAAIPARRGPRRRPGRRTPRPTAPAVRRARRRRQPRTRSRPRRCGVVAGRRPAGPGAGWRRASAPTPHRVPRGGDARPRPVRPSSPSAASDPGSPGRRRTRRARSGGGRRRRRRSRSGPAGTARRTPDPHPAGRRAPASRPARTGPVELESASRTSSGDGSRDPAPRRQGQLDAFGRGRGRG